MEWDPNLRQKESWGMHLRLTEDIATMLVLFIFFYIKSIKLKFIASSLVLLYFIKIFLKRVASQCLDNTVWVNKAKKLISFSCRATNRLNQTKSGVYNSLFLTPTISTKVKHHSKLITIFCFDFHFWKLSWISSFLQNIWIINQILEKKQIFKNYFL